MIKFYEMMFCSIEVAITLLNLLFSTFPTPAKYKTSSMFLNNAKELALTTLFPLFIPQSVPQSALHHHCKFPFAYLSFPQSQQTFPLHYSKKEGWERFFDEDFSFHIIGFMIIITQTLVSHFCKSVMLKKFL